VQCEPLLRRSAGGSRPCNRGSTILHSTRRTLATNGGIRKLILNAFSVRAAPSRFRRRCCVIEINPETYGGWDDIVAFYFPSSAGEAIQSLDRFTASASRVDLCGTRCTSQRYQVVGMTGSPIWLASRTDYYSLYEEVVDLGQGFWPRHNRPVIGFGAITSHLVVPLHFAKRGFESVVRIIKR
jgi:hypothetical protein